MQLLFSWARTWLHGRQKRWPTCLLLQASIKPSLRVPWSLNFPLDSKDKWPPQGCLLMSTQSFHDISWRWPVFKTQMEFSFCCHLQVWRQSQACFKKTLKCQSPTHPPSLLSALGFLQFLDVASCNTFPSFGVVLRRYDDISFVVKQPEENIYSSIFPIHQKVFYFFIFFQITVKSDFFFLSCSFFPLQGFPSTMSPAPKYLKETSFPVMPLLSRVKQ